MIDKELMEQFQLLASKIENVASNMATKEYVETKIDEARRHMEALMETKIDESRRHMEVSMDTKIDKALHHMEVLMDTKIDESRRHMEVSMDTKIDKALHHMEALMETKIDESRRHMAILIETSVTKRIDSLFDGYKLTHEKQYELERQNEVLQVKIESIEQRLAVLESKTA